MKGSRELHVKSRALTGKKCSRKLMRENKIPAVFYHKAKENVLLEVEYNVFQKFMNAGHGIIDLVINEKEKKQVFIKSVQYHPVKDLPTHIDFQGITAGVAIKTEVSVVLVGEAIGIKSGGYMEHKMRTLSIECLPKNLPDSLEVDVTNLDIGQSIHISDLSFENITILSDLEDTLCQMEAPKVAEEPVDEDIDVEEATEPEVINQKDVEE